MAQALFAAAYAKPTTTEDCRLEFVNCTFLDGCLFFGWHWSANKDEQPWLEQVKDLPFSLDIAYYEPPRRHGSLNTNTAPEYSEWSNADPRIANAQLLWEHPDLASSYAAMMQQICFHLNALHRHSSGWESNEEKQYDVPRRDKVLKYTPERLREVCRELLAGRGGEAFTFRFCRDKEELVLSGCVSTIFAMTNPSG
ncbi:hypothetical protein TI39_contig341g00010 [Zymoseptoria brevis]|uniref:Uncharacterized protein n=1 Tax=Zymoseptoria brevis TaxID=1047168 RepID=A0A0F4GVB2_9PEZI|nr:hypothetical protein TI39_contig341g00010 [Zymoseptoria brevis]